MTILMDRFFTKIGFESEELKACSIRSILYVGMIFTMGMASAFTIMAMLG